MLDAMKRDVQRINKAKRLVGLVCTLFFAAIMSLAITAPAMAVGMGGSAIAVRSTGEADVAVWGANNSLMYYCAMPNGPWSSVAIAGDSFYPAIAVRSTSEADVVALAMKSSLPLMYYHDMSNGPWSSGTTPSGGGESSIAVRSTGEVDVASEGANNSVIYSIAPPSSSLRNK
jgi:hypothetical protein